MARTARLSLRWGFVCGVWMKGEVYPSPPQKNSEEQLRKITGDLRTRSAKCTEVDGGFVEHSL